MDTDRVILMSSTLTLGSTLAHSMLPENMGGKGELPSARLLIGSSLAFMGLSILGAGAPRIATGLAITMATTALTFYGIPLADAYFNGNTPRKTPDGAVAGYTVTVNGKAANNEGG